jgi:hypothetical protein
MITRLLSGLAAATFIVYLAGTALGTMIAPEQPKIIATVVAHAHTSEASGFAHGL